MDTLCGIGLPELIILVLLGFVVIGPERSREVALQLGRWLRTAIQSPWWREFNQITNSIRDLPTTLVRMAELEEAQQEIQRTLQDIEQDTQVDIDLRAAMRGTTAAPEPPEDPWGIQTTPPAPTSQSQPSSPPADDVPDADESPPTDPPDVPPGDDIISPTGNPDDEEGTA